ncbi:MAG: hypothetical protein U0Q22_19675 [Acidimicrobiales bacterium]
MIPTGQVGPRHLGTPAAAILLLVASRLALTRVGLASASPSIEVASLVSGLSDARLRWGGHLLLLVLGAGLILGPTVMIGRRWALVVWWVLSAFVLVGALALLALLGGNAGGAVIAVGIAGFVAIASGGLDLWWRRRLPTSATPEPDRQTDDHHEQGAADEPPA